MTPRERPFWEQNLALLRARYPGLAEELGGMGSGEWGVGSGEDLGSREWGVGNGVLVSKRNVLSTRSDSIQQSLLPTPYSLLPNWHLEQTPTGQPTLAYQENPSSPPILIHSRRDPVREGQRQAEAALSGGGEGAPSGAASGGTTGGVIILLGFGLGYTAEALAKSGCLLVVVERRKELFQIALEQRNLEALLSPGKAVFVIGGNGVGGVLALLEKSPVTGGKLLTEGKLQIVKNRALTTLTAEDEAWYAEAEKQINTWASKDEINAATLRRFGKRWTRNLADNLAGVLHFPGVNHLANVFSQTGIPVFLAAAGPSLGRVGPHLAEIRQRCVIIAVDTSLRFLLAHGIEPDFVVSVDPQYWNVRHLHRAAAPNAALIAESAVYPSILKPILRGGEGEAGHSLNSVGFDSFKRVFFCQSLFPLGRFIEDRTDPKGVLGAGGSVATSAWDFARLLGTDAIWIAGLDLAFPGRQTHFKGALFEENAHAVSERFCPAETLSMRALESGFPFTGRSAAGGKVLTDRRLSLYAAWFESRFRESALAAEQPGTTEQAAGSEGEASEGAGNEGVGLRNYSLSPDGLAIPGLVLADPEKLLALPDRREEIDRRLETVYSRIAEDFYGSEKKESRTIRYTQAVKSLIQGLELIRDSAQDAASAAATAIKSNAATSSFATNSEAQSAKQEKVLQKLDKTNAAIAKSPVKDAAGFLFPPVAELERELVETDPLKRHLEFSLRFYRSLAESADFTLRYLKNNREHGIRAVIVAGVVG